MEAGSQTTNSVNITTNKVHLCIADHSKSRIGMSEEAERKYFLFSNLKLPAYDGPGGSDWGQAGMPCSAERGQRPTLDSDHSC